MSIQTGQRVERIGSEKDYTTGRRGIVLAILENERAQVSWDTEPIRHGGGPMKPSKTKVAFRFLKILA